MGLVSFCSSHLLNGQLEAWPGRVVRRLEQADELRVLCTTSGWQEKLDTSLKMLLYSFMCVYVCMCALCMCVSVCAGQGIICESQGSFLLPHWSWGWNWGCQTWRQASFLTVSPHWVTVNSVRRHVAVDTVMLFITWLTFEHICFWESGLGYANSTVFSYSFAFYLGIIGLIKEMNSEVSLQWGGGGGVTTEKGSLDQQDR